MSEQIATWAEYVTNVSATILWTAFLVKSVALGNAGWAAFISPLALISWLLCGIWLAKQFGWSIP